jgi:hypothetical protein
LISDWLCDAAFRHVLPERPQGIGDSAKLIRRESLHEVLLDAAQVDRPRSPYAVYPGGGKDREGATAI